MHAAAYYNNHLHLLLIQIHKNFPTKNQIYPTAIRKAKTVFSFGLSECKLVKLIYLQHLANQLR